LYYILFSSARSFTDSSAQYASASQKPQGVQWKTSPSNFFVQYYTPHLGFCKVFCYKYLLYFKKRQSCCQNRWFHCALCRSDCALCRSESIKYCVTPCRFRLDFVFLSVFAHHFCI